jgi:hypothetical protein
MIISFEIIAFGEPSRQTRHVSAKCGERPSVNHLLLGTTLGPSVQDRNCVLELACFLIAWPRSRAAQAGPAPSARRSTCIGAPSRGSATASACRGHAGRQAPAAQFTRRSRTTSCGCCSRRRLRSWLPARPPSRDRPHRLQGRHGSKPCCMVRRTSSALLAVGETSCSPSWPAFWCRYTCALGHIWHDAAVRAVREAAVANRSGVGGCVAG